MSWPVLNTDSLEDEAKLVSYMKHLSASEIADHEFWPGHYDDFSGAPMLAGYRIDWIEPYYFEAHSPKKQGTIKYVEGDLYFIPYPA